MNCICYIHPNNEASLYCTLENQYYCLDCLENHNGHNLISAKKHIEALNIVKKLTKKYSQLHQIEQHLLEFKQTVANTVDTLLKPIQDEIKSMSSENPTLSQETGVFNNFIFDTYKTFSNYTIDHIISFAHDPCKLYNDASYIFQSKSIIHYWIGSTLMLYDPKHKAKTPITLDKPINDYSDSISVGQNIYIMGGYGPSDQVYQIDMNNAKVIEKAPMLTKKYYHTLCSNNELIYSIGGTLDSKTAISDCQTYDIESDKWGKLSDLNTARCACASFIWNYYIYAFCGFPGINTLERIPERYGLSWEYVPVENSPGICWNMHAIATNDSIIILGR